MCRSLRLAPPNAGTGLRPLIHYPTLQVAPVICFCLSYSHARCPRCQQPPQVFLDTRGNGSIRWNNSTCAAQAAAAHAAALCETRAAVAPASRAGARAAMTYSAAHPAHCRKPCANNAMLQMPVWRRAKGAPAWCNPARRRGGHCHPWPPQRFYLRAAGPRVPGLLPGLGRG